MTGPRPRLLKGDARFQPPRAGAALDRADIKIQTVIGVLALLAVVFSLVEGNYNLALAMLAGVAGTGVQVVYPRARTLPTVFVALLAPWVAGLSPYGFAGAALAATALACVGQTPPVALVLGLLGVCSLVFVATDEGVLIGCTAAAVLGMAGIFRIQFQRAAVNRGRLVNRDLLLRRYALASDGAQTGLWHWIVAEVHVTLTPQAEEMLGLPPATVHAVDDWLGVVEIGDVEALRSELTRFASGSRSRFEQRVRATVAGRGERSLLFRATVERDAAGKALRLAGSVEDVTTAIRQERELLRSAFHDPLTGLANRALLLDRLAHAIAQGRRYPARPFAVLFLDIDNFKNVNDSLGHQVGDALLRVVAERLDRIVRPSDTLARLGGDEFVVLGHELHVAQAEALAERMIAAVRVPVSVLGHEVVPSASIGVAPGCPYYTDGLDLLRDADTAMYRAKQEGRGRVCLFTETMHASAVERLEVERDLHRAVERNELEVHFQPIVDLVSLKVCGFESLVRWRRNGVLTPPDRFIPIAEETGQIVPMTWWILEASCLALADWRRRGLGDDLWVHVNFSGRQLSEGNAVAGILAVVDRCGLPPGAVHIELTETSVLKQGDTVDATLAALRAAGLQLHLDDFGTGYSSISYLHRWRFDGIKIDRSFVSSIREQPQRNIVAAIIQLARGLHMHVIAEGVETEEQAQILRDLGCPFAQGYLFAAALPADRARALLQASQPEPRITLS